MRLVFDIGGTNVRVASAANGEISEVHRGSMPQDADSGLQMLVSLAKECARSDPESVHEIFGGFPGTVDENGTVLGSAPFHTAWIGINLHERLHKLFPAARIRIENDANLAALGEAVRGAGRGARIVAYIGIGTGVGCGRIVGGRIDRGRFELEAGHQIIDLQNFRDLESFVSGSAVAKKSGVHPSQAPRALYDQLTPTLAVGVYNMIVHWSPDVVVLGGSMMNEENGFRLADIDAVFKRIPPLYPTLPELRRAALGDSNGLIGAAVHSQ